MFWYNYFNKTTACYTMITTVHSHFSNKVAFLFYCREFYRNLFFRFFTVCCCKKPCSLSHRDFFLGVLGDLLTKVCPTMLRQVPMYLPVIENPNIQCFPLFMDLKLLNSFGWHSMNSVSVPDKNEWVWTFSLSPMLLLGRTLSKEAE